MNITLIYTFLIMKLPLKRKKIKQAFSQPNLRVIIE